MCKKSVADKSVYLRCLIKSYIYNNAGLGFRFIIDPACSVR